MAIEHKHKNEESVLREYGANHQLNSVDLYNFATKVLEPICEKYFVYSGIKAKIKTKASKPKPGADLHRAAFKVTATSLSDSSQERFSVLCKLYRHDSEMNQVIIDYTAVMNGFYKYIASVICGAVYYLRIEDVYRYQAEMGNSCVVAGGKFIAINGDFFMNEAQYCAELKESDLKDYNDGYQRYVA